MDRHLQITRSLRLLLPGFIALLLTGLACDAVKTVPPKNANSSSQASTSATEEASSDVPKIPYENFRLANGLNVVLHVDNKLPAVNVNLWYHVGSKNEEAGKTGFAHLFEHMMFQGSKNVKGEYLTLIERAGANLKTGGVNGTTNFDRTNYFETVPTSSLEYALWLESDRMGFLLDALDEKSFKNQQDVVKNEKRQGDNRPYSESRYLLSEAMYPAGHPYAHTVIGSLDDLSRASLEDVQEFFRKYYAPNNASLVLSGNFNPESAKQLILKYFGPIPSGPAITRPKKDIPILAQNKLIVRKERVPQAQLTMAWHVPGYFDKDEAPLDFASQILGKEKNSRLYNKLVRDEKLATRLSVYNSAREIAGLFVVEALIAPNASIDKVKEIIIAELESLGSEGPTSSELKRRKADHEYDFISQLERIGGFGGKADRFNRYSTYLGTPNGFNADYQRYQNVTNTDITRVVKDWVVDRHYLEIRFEPELSTRPNVQEFDRTVEPSLAGQVPIVLPTIESQVLDNGLQIYLINKPSLPKVDVALITKQGNLDETPDTAGLTYMTVASMDNGTASRSALDIQNDLGELGSSLSTEGSKFGTAILLSSLKKHLNGSMEILADVVKNPNFPEKELEITKQIRLNQIQQEKKNPSQLANSLFPRILFAGKHPAGIPVDGTTSSIGKISRKQLVSTHDTYWRPNNAAILFVGDMKMSEAEALTKQHFASWTKGEIPTPTIPDAPAPNKTYVFLVDNQGAPQSQIHIGSIAPTRHSTEYFSEHVTNGILGGTFSSRLNLNLREDKGWSYGAFSNFVQQKYFGYWSARAGVQTQATILALQEFKKEIEGMSGAIPITADELNGLKKNLSRSYLQNFETLSQTVRQIAPLISNDVPVEFIKTYIPGVISQTPEMVVATAKKHLRFNNAIVLVVGDLRLIEKPILDMNWGETLVLNDEGKLLRRAGQQPEPVTNPVGAATPPENGAQGTAPSQPQGETPATP
jgi:zinc protease